MEEESSVLSLNGHLRPFLSVGVFKFPTSPGLSSSRARLHSVLQQLEISVGMFSQQREGTTSFIMGASHTTFSHEQVFLSIHPH